MGKAPASQFYWSDWLNDVELQAASTVSRGVWINALSRMWFSKTKGEIKGNFDKIITLLNCTGDEFIIFLNDAHKHNFCEVNLNNANVTFPLHVTHHVTLSNADVTLRNRRMYREEKERYFTRLRVARHREKKISNGKTNARVTVASSSSSSKEIYKEKFHVTAKRVLTYLNEVGKKQFTPTESNLKNIISRLKENHTEEECKRVIDTKNKDPDFEDKWFRPVTLFRASKFEGYLNEREKKRIW